MTISFVLALLFVIGLVLLAFGSNTPQSWAVKAGTICMALAGVLWLVVGHVRA